MKFLLLAVTVVFCYDLKGQEVISVAGVEQVIFESYAGNGSVIVLSGAREKDKSTCIKSAASKVIEAFLFTGITGSSNSAPVLSNDSFRVNPLIKNLLASDYKYFLTKNDIVFEQKLIKRKDGFSGYKTVHRITLNADGLLRYLADKKIITNYGLL